MMVTVCPKYESAEVQAHDTSDFSFCLPMSLKRQRANLKTLWGFPQTDFFCLIFCTYVEIYVVAFCKIWQCQ